MKMLLIATGKTRRDNSQTSNTVVTRIISMKSDSLVEVHILNFHTSLVSGSHPDLKKKNERMVEVSSISAAFIPEVLVS